MKIVKHRRCAESTECDRKVLERCRKDCIDLPDSEEDLPLAVLKMRPDQSASTQASSVVVMTALIYRRSCYLRKDVRELARECDVYGFSDRSAAVIASAVLQDFSPILANS